MSLRSAKLIAFDGTHASGKTTLIYAAAALLRSRGVHVGVLGEPARTSPFVDDVVIHQSGDFDIALELDLFAAHITNCVRAARQYDVVFTDKTTSNVLAYCRLVLSPELGSWDERAIKAMEAFGTTWVEVYDAIIYCQDHFGTYQAGDAYRTKVAHLQDEADKLVRAEYDRLTQPLALVPLGLSINDRAKWVLEHLESRGLLAGGN